MRESARYFAGRIIDVAGSDVGKHIERTYLAALSRPPAPAELSAGRDAVQALTGQWLDQLQKEVPTEPRQSKAQWLGLASFCQVILNSPDFVYID